MIQNMVASSGAYKIEEGTVTFVAGSTRIIETKLTEIKAIILSYKGNQGTANRLMEIVYPTNENGHPDSPRLFYNVGGSNASDRGNDGKPYPVENGKINFWQLSSLMDFFIGDYAYILVGR